MNEYYNQKTEDIINELNSSEKGITTTQARSLLDKYGKNELITKNEINKFKLFLSQFKSFIIYILLFAVVLSVVVHEYIDAIIILIILIINALIGFFQELSAQKSLDALQKLNTLNAKVFRNQKLITIDSKELVIGDIVYLEAGDKVPADCRIINSNNLKVEESALTGESVPVNKNENLITKNVQIGDQKNMLFSSTSIAQGTVTAIIVKTGMETEIGKITSLIRNAKEELTPLQKKLDSFGKKLGYVIIGICIIILLVFGIKEYLANGLNPKVLLDVFLISVALAVAAVPEGLPAVVTVTLSIGVKKLLKKKALVRKLSSVETLGSCNVICTDKTGTLTQNQMTVQNAWTLDNEVIIDGIGYNPNGTISGKINSQIFKIGEACNNATLNRKNNFWTITGDPTEAALLVSARKANIKFNYKRIKELPFDSSRKMMSVLIQSTDSKTNKKTLETLTKGAPDQILNNCTHVILNGREVKLTTQIKNQILKQNDKFASKALRVLAFAYKNCNSEKDFKESNLTFVGLQAMIDPPRPDVIESIKRTKRAGIRVIMITGDYKETAKAIGEKIGIFGEIITGEELSKLNDRELEKALNNDTNLFARVIPEHKQRIVSILQKQKNIVAMTGDGVNDAPALKKANIGVAVGSGTDVAKEAADFVLLDNSFTNIVNAIEEGRGIYDNIQKTIMHLLSGNLSEVLIIFLAVLFGWNLPLTAIMLLWINLITDGAPALALAVDPYSKNIMNQKPKPANEGILPKRKIALITLLGSIITIIALVMFNMIGNGFNTELDTLTAQTAIFLFIVLTETILLLLIRNYYGTPMFSNKWIWYAFTFSIVLQLIVIYSPLKEIFNVTSLGMETLGIIAIGTSIFILSTLITKWFIIPPKYNKTN